MSEFQYKDYLPANARILIDYNAKKGEKVKFSYPNSWTYKKAVWKRAFPTVMNYWLSLHWFLVYIVIYGLLPTMAIAFGYLATTSYFYEPVTTTTTLAQSFASLVMIPVTLFYMIGIPILWTYYLSRDKERLSNAIPIMGFKAAKRCGMYKEMTYTVIDIVDDNKIVLPAFANVYLNWIPTQDFNKYLEKIEIIEIPFNFIRKIPLTFGKKKKEYNEFIFRAVFFFSQKPEKGELKIEFI